MKITKIVLPDDKDFNDSNSYPHPGFYEVTQFGAPLEGNIYCVPIDKSLFPWSIQKEYIYQIFEYLHNESLNVKQKPESFTISENTFLKTLAVVTGKVDNVILD